MKTTAICSRCHRLRPIGGLANHFDVCKPVQRSGHAVAHHFVIVHQQHAVKRAFVSRLPRAVRFDCRRLLDARPDHPWQGERDAAPLPRCAIDSHRATQRVATLPDAQEAKTSAGRSIASQSRNIEAAAGISHRHYQAIVREVDPEVRQRNPGVFHDVE